MVSPAIAYDGSLTRCESMAAGSPRTGQCQGAMPAPRRQTPLAVPARRRDMVLVCCQAGWTQHVTAALSLTMADLFDNRKGIVHRYPMAATCSGAPIRNFSIGNHQGHQPVRADKTAKAESVSWGKEEKDVLASSRRKRRGVLGDGCREGRPTLVGAGGPRSEHRGREGQTGSRICQGRGRTVQRACPIHRITDLLWARMFQTILRPG